MILSTTPQIEGHTIREYKGIVTGETIIGANMFKDLFAGIRDIVGGRAGAYEKVLSEAKDTSMQEMMQRAQALGANAISEFKFSASLTSAIVILARILSIGMYFAYLLVKAEANKPRRSRTYVKLKV